MLWTQLLLFLAGVLGVLGPGGAGDVLGWGLGPAGAYYVWGYFSTLHSRLLSDQTQLKDDVDMLRRENGQLLRERNLLQQSWEDMKRLHEEDQKEIGDLRAQQQQVGLGRVAGCKQRSVTHPPTHSPIHLHDYLIAISGVSASCEALGFL